MENDIKFEQFSHNFYNLIKDAFKKFIEPYYADQSDALKKIHDAVDRSCEILFLNNLPIGFIVYKKSLQNEFGLTGAFELKTLLLFNATKHAGLGKILFRRAEVLANEYKAKYIYATVSHELLSLIKYMKKDGWSILKTKKSDDNHIDIVVMFKELRK